MKLIRLKILDSFRSLNKDFEIDFHNTNSSKNLTTFHPFCLVGQNGTGKSNVLEALSNIFYHLECCTNVYPEYAFSKNESSPDAYELEYFLLNVTTTSSKENLDKIKILKDNGSCPKMSINGESFIEISKEYGKSFLPDLVVAYSSGENETLSLPFQKMKLYQYDQYIQDFINDNIYDKPKSSLLYIDYEMSQAVLLTILLFYDFEKDGQKSVLSPLDEELGIKGIQQFTINLHNNWQKIINNYNSYFEVETISDENYTRDKEKKKYKGRILDHLSEQIKKIEDCATCVYKRENIISLDFWVNDCTKNLIRKKFNNNPYDFFSIFQMLQALNERVEDSSGKIEIYNSKGFYTDYKKAEYKWFFNFTNYFLIKKDKKSGKINDLLLKQLSDGEQQFLHTLGICLMLKGKRTLLLLDEPETHFNPDWRSKFINILRKTLEAGGENFLSKDIILTSHSPFIISDCKPENVILFKKHFENNLIETESASKKNFNTYGASVDIILQEIFDVKHSISQEALDEIKTLLKSDSTQSIIEGAKNFGESYEKGFLFEKIEQLRNSQKINK
jgi:restriction system-associated AAA family ATPase